MTTKNDGNTAKRNGQQQASRFGDEEISAALPSGEAGDHMNRFLLCALVSESARCIRASAEKAGEHLAMPLVVRSVLRSYRLATKDKHGPFADHSPDMPALGRLNERILRAEIARQSQDRMKKSEARPDDGKRLRQEAGVQPELRQVDPHSQSAAIESDSSV